MVDILMPALSPTMTEGKLAKWLKKPGDEIKSGDVIAEIETDKATMEVEAVDEGMLNEILVEEGTEGVPVNTIIARMGGDVAAAKPAPKAEPAPAKEEAPAKAEATSPAPAPAHASAAAAPEPEYGETKPTTVREALREAMNLEMRADKDVFLMGEEVAQYQGAYKVSQGMLDEFGPRNTICVPICPPDIYKVFDAELMIWSIACMAKLKVMNSTIGRRPFMAAPTPMPVNPCSVIGVSITRRAPNSSSKP